MCKSQIRVFFRKFDVSEGDPLIEKRCIISSYNQSLLCTQISINMSSLVWLLLTFMVRTSFDHWENSKVCGVAAIPFFISFFLVSMLSLKKWNETVNSI